MITAADFSVDSVQASAFVAEDELAPHRALRRALQDWSNVYDADPLSIPLPPHMPADVPGVILGSREGSQRLEIARSRVNFHAVRLSGQASLDVGTFYEEFSGQLVDIFDHEHVSIGRLAAVVNRSAPDQSPARTIAQQYFRDEWLRAPLNRPSELELHAHKVFELKSGLPINSWMRIRTGWRIETNDQVVTVEQDMNTLEENRSTSTFDREAVASFYRLVTAELTDVLNLYFPAHRDGERT